MSLIRALHAETLKMKRTIALKMGVLSPAIVVLLILFIASQAPYSMLHRNGIKGEWTELARLNLRLWAFLMMPLYVTLQTALIAGVDHSENQWKSLLARPVPRWTLYVSKLIVVSAMTAASTILLACGILIDGAVLPHLNAELVFGSPVPWAAIVLESSQVAGLMFLGLTIQHWVSLRWRAFSVATGTGIVATVMAFLATAAGRQMGGWPQYFPWSLPMLVLARQPQNLEAILAISSALALTVAVAGCFDFCRREVQ